MRTIGFVIAVFGFALPASIACSQSPASVESATVSQANGIPLATVYSNMVTQSAANKIQSGLPGYKYTVESSSAKSDVLQNLESAAAARGFIVRAVELDPRFQANVSRIIGQIDLKQLAPVSALPGQIESGPGAVEKTFRECDFNRGMEFCSLTSSPRMVPAINSDVPSDATSDVTAELTAASPNEDNNNGRIFGGTAVPADADVFRDVVALIGNNALCTGVLVAKDTVLTAAHCYCDGVISEALIGTSIIGDNLVRIPIDKLHSEAFKACSAFKQDISIGDIAILKLKTAADVSPKPIGGLQLVREAASVRAVGFGKINDGTYGQKYQVNTIIASYQCDGSENHGIPDQQVYRCRPRFELVAAGLNRDTCNGDSGGPIYVFGDDAKPYLVGLTSRSITPSGNCGPGGIYELLAAPPVRQWLVSNGIPIANSAQ
jgi:hypothetical protein